MAGDLKSLMIVLLVISVGITLFGTFYTDMAVKTGHSSSSLEALSNKSLNRVNVFVQNATPLLNSTKQPDDLSAFTFGYNLIVTGANIFYLLISIPGTFIDIGNLASQAIADASGGTVVIPGAFVALITTLVAIIVIFAIAKFISGRSD